MKNAQWHEHPEARWQTTTDRAQAVFGTQLENGDQVQKGDLYPSLADGCWNGAPMFMWGHRVEVQASHYIRPVPEPAFETEAPTGAFSPVEGSR